MNSTRRSFLSCLGAAIGAALAWPLGLKAAAVQGTDMAQLCGLWPRSYIPLEPGTKLVVPKGYEYISPD